MNNRQVLLISPVRPELIMTGYAHRGLALLARKLIDNGFNVKILDYLIDRNIPGIEETIRDFKPGIVGVTINTAFWSKADEILGMLARYPDIKVLAGGPHPTLYHEEMAADKRVHYVFMGEAEESIVAVCAEAELPEKPVVIQPSRPEPDNIPIPDFECACNHHKIVEYPLQTSRGCPFGCIFCEVSNISSKKWRPLPLDTVIAELNEAKEKYKGIKKIEIIDDNPAFKPEHFKEFLVRFSEMNDGWEIVVDNMRADNIDAEMARLLEKANCRSVCFGVEHGNPEMFKSVNKGETLEDIREASKVVKKTTMKLGMCFVIGLPGDSFKKTKDSIKFAKENNADFMFWNVLVPHCGTKVRKWFEENGRIYNDRDFSPNIEDAIYTNSPVCDCDDFPKEEMLRAHFYAVLTTNNYWLNKRNRKYVIKTALKYGFFRQLFQSIIVQLYRKNFVKD